MLLICIGQSNSITHFIINQNPCEDKTILFLSSVTITKSFYNTINKKEISTLTKISWIMPSIIPTSKKW
jgi:hypothetical protein